MTDLAYTGANYFRYIISPWQTEIEFEELGNYSDRLPNAWEFDQILEHANELDLKLHLNLVVQEELQLLHLHNNRLQKLLLTKHYLMRFKHMDKKEDSKKV